MADERGREDETLFDHGIEAHLDSGGGGGYPGEQPDEIVPGQGVVLQFVENAGKLVALTYAGQRFERVQ